MIGAKKSTRLALAFAPAALGASLLFVAAPAPAQTDPFALRPEFVTQAAFSCGDVTINGGGIVDSLGIPNQGHVVSNGGITLNGNSIIRGNATAGPGKTIKTNGLSRVVGTKGNLTSAWPCSPVDLTPLAAGRSRQSSTPACWYSRPLSSLVS